MITMKSTHEAYNLEFKWTVSRGRDTYGYNICTLYVGGRKVSACNGGGYDMQGTSLGEWLAVAFKDDLLKLKKEFYGLTFHDPNYDPGKHTIQGETVEQREKDGKSIGLERYQAFYAESSKLPTEKHIIPQIDGACGMSSVEAIARAIGFSFQYVQTRSKSNSVYIMTRSS